MEFTRKMVACLGGFKSPSGVPTRESGRLPPGAPPCLARWWRGPPHGWTWPGGGGGAVFCSRRTPPAGAATWPRLLGRLLGGSGLTATFGHLPDRDFWGRLLGAPFGGQRPDRDFWGAFWWGAFWWGVFWGSLLVGRLLGAPSGEPSGTPGHLRLTKNTP